MLLPNIGCENDNRNGLKCNGANLISTTCGTNIVQTSEATKHRSEVLQHCTTRPDTVSLFELPPQLCVVKALLNSLECIKTNSEVVKLN